MEFYTNKALDPNRKKKYKRSELKNYNVFRSNPNNDYGLKLERRIAEDGTQKKYFIREITPGGLIDRQNFDLEVGDRIVEINGVEMEEFPGLYQIHDLIKKEMKLTVSLLKEEKEKKWLHAPKKQYPGQMDKPVHKETFRPGDEKPQAVYPPPNPDHTPTPINYIPPGSNNPPTSGDGTPRGTGTTPTAPAPAEPASGGGSGDPKSCCCVIQ